MQQNLWKMEPKKMKALIYYKIWDVLTRLLRMYIEIECILIDEVKIFGQFF